MLTQHHYLRKQGEILANATTFRFDASDLMPGAIGAGAFWSEMTAFANGQDAKTTADNIQAAWDAIKVILVSKRVPGKSTGKILCSYSLIWGNQI